MATNQPPKNYAAIDVGSNALRMAVGHMEGQALTLTRALREPIRLGDDTFHFGHIQEDTIQALEYSFKKFKHIIDTSQIEQTYAVATSALREADNRDDVLKRIHRASGIELQLIDGLEEARLVHRAVFNNLESDGRPLLIMDIGGGSVEVIYSLGEEIISRFSMKAGTVRLLQHAEDKPDAVLAFKEKIREQLKELQNLHPLPSNTMFVGSGGNVRSLGRLGVEPKRQMKKRWKLSYERLLFLAVQLNRMSVVERIRDLKLRADRADVILPASHIILEIMDEFGFSDMVIPRVSLKHGLLYSMIEST